MQAEAPARRATMTDVARVAEVSLKTVSRYVNGETNIDPTIAARIAEAIGALRFRRNMAAASIRPGQRSQLVGLIIEDVANPFYSALTRSVELALRSEGLLLLAASSEEDPTQFGRLVEQLIERRVDGLIVVPPSHPEPRWPELAREIPALVLLDRSDENINADSIVGDDRTGGQAATQLLLDSGARRIVFVGEGLGLSTISGRHQGYLAALSTAGLVPDPDLVIDGVRTSDDVCTAVTEMLRRGVQVDAFFAANNLASLGVLKAFRRLGVSRPIVGYDDFESAALVQPAVTVVSHSVSDMGRRAAELLLARINGDRTPPHHLVLPAVTTLRASHRAPSNPRNSPRKTTTQP